MRKPTDDELANRNDSGAAPGAAPESDTFRPGARRVLLFLIPAVILFLACLFLPGNVGLGTRAVGVTIGILLLRLALLRALYRVRMNPDGILITGEPGIPWPAITGCRLLRFAGGSGFEIEYRDREGREGRVRVPGGLERYREAWRLFLAMTERHGAAWSFSESVRKLKEILRSRDD